MRVLVLLVALVTVPAAAEELPPGERDARAHAWFERGRASFKLGYYAAAVEEFEEGYKYLPQPLFLYNIAQSARRAGQVKKALDSYRAYLKVRPDAPERKECEQRIVELEKLATPAPPKLIPPEPSPQPVAVAPSPAPVVIVAPPSPQPRVVESKPVLVMKAVPGRKKTLAGAILAAVGVGALGGGLASAMIANDANDQIHADARMGRMYDPAVQSRGLAANSAATAMFVIGGAALVSGVVALAVGVRESRPGNRKAPTH